MRTSLAFLTAGLCACSLPAADAIDYLREVKPILTKNCTGCHGADKQRSGLRLDTAKAALKGGNTGPAILPGKSASSLLVHAITGTNDVTAMPPKGPRPSEKGIALLKRWIDDGARAPADEVAQTIKKGSNHWAFQPPRRLAPPAVRDTVWPRNAIDRFILARLEKENIKPSPEAD